MAGSMPIRRAGGVGRGTQVGHGQSQTFGDSPSTVGKGRKGHTRKAHRGGKLRP